MVNENDRGGRSVTILPPIGKVPAVTPYNAPALPVRPAPAVPLPYIDSRMSRRRLVKLTDHFSAATAATDSATRLYTSLATLETARQEAERVHAGRRHLPLVVEAQRLGLLAQIARGHVDLAAVLDELHQQRVEREQQQQLLPLQVEKVRLALEHDLTQARSDAAARRADQEHDRARRERRRQLDEEEFEIRRMELATRRQEAEAALRQAGSLAALRGESERHQAEAEVHRTRAEAEKMRRSAMPPDTGGIPEHLRQHLAAELEIRKNRAPAAQVAEAIRDRATAEGRALSDDELELVDLYESAAAGAEESIRRGAASDLEE